MSNEDEREVGPLDPKNFLALFREKRYCSCSYERDEAERICDVTHAMKEQGQTEEQQRAVMAELGYPTEEAIHLLFDEAAAATEEISLALYGDSGRTFSCSLDGEGPCSQAAKKILEEASLMTDWKRREREQANSPDEGEHSERSRLAWRRLVSFLRKPLTLISHLMHPGAYQVVRRAATTPVWPTA